MNFLDALKGDIGFPISDNTGELKLMNRGLEKDATYTVANQQAFELAVADTLIFLTSQPNIQEGSFSLTLPEREALRKRANDIYLKYGIGDIVKPKGTFVKRW